MRLLMAAALIFCLIACPAVGEVSLDGQAVVKKMQAAYETVTDYRANVEVKHYKKDGTFETEKFRYTFKKPTWIRLDFESPHPGMVLVYPDSNGKVAVQPGGLAHLLKLHLAPDNRLLAPSSGQRIDQTDIGLLIRNISHSLTDQRRGPEDISEEGECVKIRVLAADHFRPNVVTLYQFQIDKSQWLPTSVEQSTANGRLERRVTFDDLKINNGFPDSLFRLDGEGEKK